jgi:hypothetical protein
MIIHVWPMARELNVSALIHINYYFVSLYVLEAALKVLFKSCQGCVWGVITVWEEVVGKGCKRVNMVQQILCTHVCKCKNDTC